MRKILSLLVILTTAILLQENAFAWSNAHSLITETAFNALPDWQKGIWNKPEPDPIWKTNWPISKGLIQNYCLLPDFADGPPNPYREAVQVYRYKGFHYFTGPEEANRSLCLTGSRWYFVKIAGAFKAGKPLEAARYAGSLAHTVEDRTSPYHCLDGYAQIREGYEKDHNLSFAFWTVSDKHVRFDLTGFQPKLLGNTPEEAAENFCRRFEEINRYSRSRMPDFIKAHLKDPARQSGRSGPETDAIQSEMASGSVKLAADMFYTGFMLGYDKVHPAQAVVKLKWTADSPGSPEPPAKLVSGKAVPVAVPDAGAEGEINRAKISNYKSADTKAAFDIAADVYHSGKASYHIVNSGPEMDLAYRNPHSALWIIPVAAEPNQTYEVSAWVKTRDVKQAAVPFRYKNAAGSYLEGGTMTEVRSVSGTAEWTQVKSTGQSPPDCGSFDVFLIIREKGEAWFDDIEVKVFK